MNFMFSLTAHVSFQKTSFNPNCNWRMSVRVELIVPKYAPLGDCNQSKTQCNDPHEYINTVETLVDWFRRIEQARG